MGSTAKLVGCGTEVEVAAVKILYKNDEGTMVEAWAEPGAPEPKRSTDSQTADGKKPRKLAGNTDGPDQTETQTDSDK